MPAPQGSTMSQLARTKFMSFGLKAPPNYQPPTDEVEQQQLRDAMTPEDRNTSPGTPPLFQPATMYRCHTDAQKMLIAKIGGFIDGMCDAIANGWSIWQASAAMGPLTIVGPAVSGGMLVGTPMAVGIMAAAPKSSQANLRYANVIASCISDAWTAFCLTVKAVMLPAFPLFATFPSPAAPPQPSTPLPFAQLVQVPVSISTNALKAMMVAKLGDPTAPFMGQLFESIAHAFEQTYNTWKTSCLVTFQGGGAVATMMTPVPVPGPVAGVAAMAPGGLA